jgi:hypothetical protein
MSLSMGCSGARHVFMSLSTGCSGSRHTCMWVDNVFLSHLSHSTFTFTYLLHSLNKLHKLSNCLVGTKSYPFVGSNPFQITPPH